MGKVSYCCVFWLPLHPAHHGWEICLLAASRPAEGAMWDCGGCDHHSRSPIIVTEGEYGLTPPFLRLTVKLFEIFPQSFGRSSGALTAQVYFLANLKAKPQPYPLSCSYRLSTTSTNFARHPLRNVEMKSFRKKGKQLKCFFSCVVVASRHSLF